MKRLFWGCVLSLSACAASAASVEARREPVGEQQSRTETWLQLQRDGGAASGHGQQLTPAERELGMARWLGSFKHEIPEFYEQDMAGEIGR